MNMQRPMRACAPAPGGLRARALGATCIVCAAWALGPLTATAATPAPAPATAETQQAGVLKSVQGEVHFLRADGAAQAARPGDAVSQVDRIRTGADSGASLRLRDGTVLVIGPQSQLDLKQYRFDTTTHDGSILLSLLQGSLRMVSGLIAKKQPEAVRIDTQTATIGIRGTDFIVSADARP